MKLSCLPTTQWGLIWDRSAYIFSYFYETTNSSTHNPASSGWKHRLEGQGEEKNAPSCDCLEFSGPKDKRESGGRKTEFAPPEVPGCLFRYLLLRRRRKRAKSGWGSGSDAGSSKQVPAGRCFPPRGPTTSTLESPLRRSD